MVEKGVIDPVKNRIPYIALSYILLKYMGILGDYLNKKLYQDFEESNKRIENKTSEALKNVINKVYDNIMEKSVQKKKQITLLHLIDEIPFFKEEREPQVKFIFINLFLYC